MELTEEQRQLLNNTVEESLNEQITEISLNSEEFLTDQNNVRFSGADWYEEIKQKEITIIGLGGIGSFTAFNISRLNPKMIALYDMDKVEETNLSGQLYAESHIGLNKISATSYNINSFSKYKHIFTRTEFKKGNFLTNIVIGCLDNMKTRKEVFETWRTNILNPNSNKKEFLFIDGRLSLEEMQVYCFTGEDSYLIDKYEKEGLFLEEEAEPVVCSRKQTTFCAAMISSIITNLVINHTVNLKNCGMKRSLPFYTYYNAETMLFKKELI